MARQSENREAAGNREPAGFTPHTSGPASERAREQGWQTNVEERARIPQGKQNEDGGTDYDYGARDFGDEPVDTSSGTSSGTGPETASEISTAQPAQDTQKKEKSSASKPRTKRAA
jgi:hypothetical protein